MNVFKACEQRLQEQLDALQLRPLNVKSFPLLMYLVSTLTAYGKLNELSADNECQSNLPINDYCMYPMNSLGAVLSTILPQIFGTS